MTRIGLALSVALATCDGSATTEPKPSTEPATAPAAPEDAPAVHDTKPSTPPAQHLFGLSDAALAAEDAVEASTAARRSSPPPA